MLPKQHQQCGALAGATLSAVAPRCEGPLGCQPGPSCDSAEPAAYGSSSCGKDVAPVAGGAGLVERRSAVSGPALCTVAPYSDSHRERGRDRVANFDARRGHDDSSKARGAYC